MSMNLGNVLLTTPDAKKRKSVEENQEQQQPNTGGENCCSMRRSTAETKNNATMKLGRVTAPQEMVTACALLE
jgi:hypothetical protein